jgi:hypothetical protein
MTDTKISAAPATADTVTTPTFVVASVEKTSAPDGGSEQDWYRYVLKSRRSTITGHRRGSAKYVHTYAAECAEQLNARAAMGQSIWSPRGRKPGAATK